MSTCVKVSRVWLGGAAFSSPTGRGWEQKSCRGWRSSNFITTTATSAACTNVADPTKPTTGSGRRSDEKHIEGGGLTNGGGERLPGCPP